MIDESLWAILLFVFPAVCLAEDLSSYYRKAWDNSLPAGKRLEAAKQYEIGLDKAIERARDPGDERDLSTSHISITAILHQLLAKDAPPESVVAALKFVREGNLGYFRFNHSIGKVELDWQAKELALGHANDDSLVVRTEVASSRWMLEDLSQRDKCNTGFIGLASSK